MHGGHGGHDHAMGHDMSNMENMDHDTGGMGHNHTHHKHSH